MQVQMTHDILDVEIFEQAKSLLGESFSQVVEAYLEDAANYLVQIHSGLSDNNLEQAAKAAHPLKSSSASLGLVGVSEIAKSIELGAKSAVSTEALKVMASDLEQTLNIARDMLHVACDAAEQ